MHKLLFLWLVVLCLLATACTRCGAGSLNAVQLAPRLLDQTVALVHQDGDGDWGAYCAGVWVGPKAVITASHCVNDEAGRRVTFITHAEQPELFEAPMGMHEGTAVVVDETVDLALIDTDEDLQQPTARLAWSTPPVGADVLVVGHPIGLMYSTLPGQVSAYKQRLRYVTETEGPFLQIASGVIGGNSGGGVFDSDGNLVGLVILKSPAPYIGFAVHLDTIRHFLKVHAR